MHSHSHREAPKALTFLHSPGLRQPSLHLCPWAYTIGVHTWVYTIYHILELYLAHTGLTCMCKHSRGLHAQHWRLER